MSNLRKERRNQILLSYIFFFSGFASLAYQVVWQRLLTLHYGIGSISTTLIVGIYMAGLGIGSWVGGLLAERVKKQVELYFWVELGIGFFGLLSLSFIDMLGKQTAGSSYFLSGLYMFLFLCIPTFLMGVTLPLLTKIFSRFSRDFLGNVSFLYFINTIGASLGALVTSYVVISFWGMDTAVYTAVAIDFILAVLIWISGRMTKNRSEDVDIYDEGYKKDGGLGHWAYVVIFITGFLAMGYEILWYRLIGVLVKDSPYAFSTTLSVYLLGIALGSLSVNRHLARHPKTNRKKLFFLLQFLIGFYIVFSLTVFYNLSKYSGFSQVVQLSFNNYLHPDPLLLNYLPKQIPPFSIIYSYLDIFFWPFIFLFIPTFFMGAAFPLASSLAVTKQNEEGRTVGMVYLFNIAGNVSGSILTGFVILPLLGSERTFLVMVVISIFGLWFVDFTRKRIPPYLFKVVILGAVIGLTFVYFPQKGDIYRVIHPPVNPGTTQIINEGMDAVVVSYHQDGPTIDYINGQEHGRFGAVWYTAWATEAAIYAPSLKNILVIGFGSGTFPAILQKMDNVEKMTVVELSPTLILNQKEITFYKDMLDDPRLNLVIEDG